MFIIIPVLVNVAFVTLIERKILGYSQYRKGPNKVSIIGIMQPVSDAVKLFRNEILYLRSRNFLIYFISPFIGLFIRIFLWIMVPIKENIYIYDYSWIFLLIIIRLGIYPLILRGWRSNRKYSLIGAIRGVAQIISYEVIFTLAIFIFGILRISLRLIDMLNFNKKIIFIFIMPFILIIFFLRCLAETNRTPFDFSEGESELVSGFNTEYISGGFAIIFIAEYIRILFLSVLIGCLLRRNIYILKFYFVITFFVFVWIWVRSTYPRHRYDLLIYLSWKTLMPYILLIIISFILLLTSY